MPKSYSKQFSLYDSGLVISSVEQLPTASASAAFTINSAKGFREDGEIAPVTILLWHLLVRHVAVCLLIR